MPVSIVPVKECSSASHFQLGCFSTGLPSDSPFEWLDNDRNKLTNFIQFAAQPRDGAYDKLSVISVAKDDWDKGKRFTCKVGNETLNIPEDKKPSVNLVKVADGESIMCITEDFFPKDFTLKLKEDGQEVTGLKWPTMRSSSGLYTSGSLLKVSKASWKKNAKYSCEVMHKNETHTRSRSFTGKFSVKIKPPGAKDLFIHNKAKMECVISGSNEMEVEAAKVSWTVGGKETDKKNIIDGVVEQKEELYIKTSTLTVEESVWFEGTAVKCSTTRDQDPVSDTISITEGDDSCSLQIYEPKKAVLDTEKISLVCEVNSSRLGDVYIVWLKGQDRKFEEGSITAPIYKNGTPMSVLSIFTVTGQEYNSEMVFTCAVKHANMKDLSTPLKTTTSKSKDNCHHPNVLDRR
ncbi:hypothetical protein MHYP_G00146170 [Metynnis hypsauchen]